MALPTNADVVVVRGYWLDETTGVGVKQGNGNPAPIVFEPVPLVSNNQNKTPNLRDAAANTYLKTRTRVATVDPVTGYFAQILVSSNDPDLDAYGGRRVTFFDEEPFIIQVPYNAPFVTVDAVMSGATGLVQGTQVRAIWLLDASLVTTPTPSPPINYLTSVQTLSTVASGLGIHDADANAHPAIRAMIIGATAALKQWAGNPDALIVGAITRNSDGAATSAGVVWPDGAVGTYTATTVSTAFPGAVDAYTVTYGSPVTKTYTQPVVTRNASGAVTQRPAITVT